MRTRSGCSRAASLEKRGDRAAARDDSPETMQNAGTMTAQYSSSRLVPLSSDRSFPYRAVGKIYYTWPNVGDFFCSASVIRRGLILTAGHCVHDGGGTEGGFFTNFMFVPAYRDGEAPFGVWASTGFVATTDEWVKGGGFFPNQADFALIELEDQVVDGQAERIGDVTGVLGYLTERLESNHAHILGYPMNLDAAERMHQVTAGSFAPMEPNSVVYGSDMRGGSSGGPFIQNFGRKADGQSGGANPFMNRVIGVASFGFIATDPKIQGSSILNASFLDLLDAACAHRPGNC